MHQIQIRLPSDDCDGTVQQMRDWLKAHGASRPTSTVMILIRDHTPLSSWSSSRVRATAARSRTSLPARTDIERASSLVR